MSECNLNLFPFNDCFCHLFTMKIKSIAQPCFLELILAKYRLTTRSKCSLTGPALGKTRLLVLEED